MNYKRSISSLAKWGVLRPGKRNLEALARAGLIHTLPEEDAEEEEDSDTKRSIANLAKNGQLPTYQSNESKRGIESLARNGELQVRNKDIEQLLDELYIRRNFGNLARNLNDASSYGKRFVGSLAKSGDLHYGSGGKRNIAALARDGNKIVGKRNVPALLRQDKFLNGQADADKAPHVRSLMGNNRNKRQADYYDGESDELAGYPNTYDYGEFIKDLNALYPNNEKRFLGG